MLTHLTAHASGQLAPLLRPASASWLWITLREAFPDALAACLMPTHVHLALPGPPGERPRRLASALRDHARVQGKGPLWGGVAEPAVFTAPDKVRRQLRYIALNPCRMSKLGDELRQLAADPLAWWWSTHRDLVGATVEPWVRPQTLREFLGDDRPRFLRRWHRYVSSDPSVRVDGTPLPFPAPRRRHPRHPLEEVIAASLAATRAGPDVLGRRSRTRRLFITLAHHEGWRLNDQLAQVCGITTRSARRLAARPALEDLEAARLCLHDGRLRRGAQSLPNAEEGPYSGRWSA